MTLRCLFVSLREQARSHIGTRSTVGASLLAKGPELAPDNAADIDRDCQPGNSRLSSTRFTASSPSMINCAIPTSVRRCDAGTKATRFSAFDARSEARQSIRLAAWQVFGQVCGCRTRHLHDHVCGDRRLRQSQMLMPKRKQHLATAHLINHWQ